MQRSIRSLVAPGLLALAVLAAGVPVGGAADGIASCKQWNVTGTWSTNQGNGFHVTFVFKQSGTTLTGKGILPQSEAASLGYSTGIVKGTVKGSRLSLTVAWVKGPVGQYVATVTSRGLAGSGRAIKPLGTWVNWSGSGPTRCTA
jgi:hypothetical protein